MTSVVSHWVTFVLIKLPSSVPLITNLTIQTHFKAIKIFIFLILSVSHLNTRNNSEQMSRISWIFASFSRLDTAKETQFEEMVKMVNHKLLNRLRRAFKIKYAKNATTDVQIIISYYQCNYAEI